MAAIFVALLEKGLLPKKVLLADTDTNVTMTWRALVEKTAASEFLEVTQEVHAKFGGLFWGTSRERWDFVKAGSFPAVGKWLYLMAGSFGGHCPPGKLPTGFDPGRKNLQPVYENLVALQDAMSEYDIRIYDSAETLLQECDESTFLYFDPPYTKRDTTHTGAAYGEVDIDFVIEQAERVGVSYLSTTDEILGAKSLFDTPVSYKCSRGGKNKEKPVGKEKLYKLR